MANEHMVPYILGGAGVVVFLLVLYLLVIGAKARKAQRDFWAAHSVGGGKVAEGATKVYAPESPAKHHVNTRGASDGEFGPLIEVMKSQGVWLFLKGLLCMGLGVAPWILMADVETAPWVGYLKYGVILTLLISGLAFWGRMRSQVCIFEKGMEISTTFGKKRYSYNQLLGMVTHRRIDVGDGSKVYRGGFLQTLSSNVFYSYDVCEMAFSGSRMLALSSRTYMFLRDKMNHLETNLVQVDAAGKRLDAPLPEQPTPQEPAGETVSVPEISDQPLPDTPDGPEAAAPEPSVQEP